MNIAVTVNVDLERSPVGTRSRLADELAGMPILRRTLERLTRVEGIGPIALLTPAAQVQRVQALCEGLRIGITRHDAIEPPYRELVTSGRHWGLDGWRGGIGGMCCFDEDLNVPLVAAYAEQAGADAILSVPAAAPLLDAALLSEMVAHYRRNSTTTKMAFVQAPPGLGGVIVERSILAELARAGLPVGAILAYQPNNPMPDLTGREACYRPAAEIIEARGRLLADTHRSWQRIERAVKEGAEGWGAARLARWLTEADALNVAPAPAEIEIELSTEDDANAASLLRPRGAAVGRRGPLDPRIIERICEWIGPYDDVRVVIGGFGEPARHPRFADIVRSLRASPARTIAVRTSARRIDKASEEAMFVAPVDVIEIAIDAASRETYRRVSGVDAFDDVMATLERWAGRRAESGRVRPLLVPSMIKAQETLDEMESFFEAWQQRFGAVLVDGYSPCAGQRPDRRVTSMTPPRRGRCRRVFARAIILADGQMTTCDQDFAGRQCVGNVLETNPASLWMESEALRAIRQQDAAAPPLCAACTDWHRP